MRISVYAVLEALFILCISVIWCEFGYYYYIFHLKCRGWPESSDLKDQQGLIRIMVLSDNHIMGPIRSIFFDKQRREWQMKQAFSFAISAYNPDVIIFLGDTFDEGSFARDDLFAEAKVDFESVFPFDPARHGRIIILGNHDVGNHYQMINYPYLLHRFHVAFGSSLNVELLNSAKLGKLNIIALNSMSLYNDSCPYCSQSIADVNRIAHELEQRRQHSPDDYSAPIILTHIPFYRPDDVHCDHPYSLKERVKNRNIEGEDVIHETISKFIISRLNPRLILSGHTHMDCMTTHKRSEKVNDTVVEITVSSFNHKYAENKPSLLLLSVDKKNALSQRCQLVEEWIIVLIYIIALVIIFLRLRVSRRVGYFPSKRDYFIGGKHKQEQKKYSN